MDIEGICIVFVLLAVVIFCGYGCINEEYQIHNPEHMKVCMEAAEKKLKIKGCE